MKFLRIKQVLERRGCCRAHLYREIAAGEFPAPIKLSPRMAVWPEADVDAWFQAKLAARDAGTPKKAPAKRPESGVPNVPVQ
jgi:prophage regulatory protein